MKSVRIALLNFLVGILKMVPLVLFLFGMVSTAAALIYYANGGRSLIWMGIFLLGTAIFLVFAICTICTSTRGKLAKLLAPDEPFHTFHDWNGCQCRVCKERRDEGHDWNGCKCRICGKQRDEAHNWDGETCLSTCRICGVLRGSDFFGRYSWSKYPLKESEYGPARQGDGHDWNGCTCRLCGKHRDEAHDWDGETCRSKCRICGLGRGSDRWWFDSRWNDILREQQIPRRTGDGHDWNGCTCRLCGRTRDTGHDWNGCKCHICGKTRYVPDEEHDWDKTQCHCLRCGKTNHDWVYAGGSEWTDTIPAGSVDDYDMESFYRTVTYSSSLYRCSKCGEEREETSREEGPIESY